MAEYFLFLSLITLPFLLLAEPITLRLTLGRYPTVGVHLSVFALLLFPGRDGKKKGSTAKRRQKKTFPKKIPSPSKYLSLARAALAALSHYADRPRVRIFTLAPEEKELPDRDALSYGAYAVIAGLFSAVLRGCFPYTVTDPDVLCKSDDVRFDVSVSIALSDLFLIACLTVCTWRKSVRKERQKLWKNQPAHRT